MPKYLFSGSYKSEGIKGLLKDGGSGRKEAVEKLMTSLGGKIESIHFAFGADDFFIIAEAPDNSKNPTPEGPALETPGRGYYALPPEGARVELPLSC